jgi:membrane protease YdiL (CAAX protease family)
MDAVSSTGATRRHVGMFYLLATLIAWAGWIPYAAQQAWGLPWRIPVAVPVLAQYSPAIAALLLTAIGGGLPGLARFLSTSLRWRVGWRWYALALLTPPAMGAALIGLHLLRGVAPPPMIGADDWAARVAGLVHTSLQFDTHAAARLPNALETWAGSGAIQASLVLLGLAIANGGLSEEAGWRGYALPGLLVGRRPLVAALWVGVLWGLWHTGPAFWEGVLQMRWSVIATPITYCLGTIPLSVMIAWVFLGARRSLLPGILFHAAYNTTFFVLTALWTPGRPVVSTLEWVAATGLFAVGYVFFGRRTLLARPETA